MVGKGKGKGKGKEKGKGSSLSRMNPTVSLVTKVEVATEVAAVAGETTEEIGLMDRHWWWRQVGQLNWTSCIWTQCLMKEVVGELLRLR